MTKKAFRDFIDDQRGRGGFRVTLWTFISWPRRIPPLHHRLLHFKARPKNLLYEYKNAVSINYHILGSDVCIVNSNYHCIKIGDKNRRSMLLFGYSWHFFVDPKVILLVGDNLLNFFVSLFSDFSEMTKAEYESVPVRTESKPKMWSIGQFKTRKTSLRI